MVQLLTLFFDILLLRRGPQVLPDSRFLLGSVLALHFLLGLVLSAFSLPFAQALGAAIIGTILVVALIQAALMVRGLPYRLVQTTTAVAGSEFLLGLLILPFRMWEATGGNQTAVSVVQLVLLGWNFAVNANIFRHALSTTTKLGVITAITYLIVSIFVAGLLTGAGV